MYYISLQLQRAVLAHQMPLTLINHRTRFYFAKKCYRVRDSPDTKCTQELVNRLEGTCVKRPKKCVQDVPSAPDLNCIVLLPSMESLKKTKITACL